MNLEDFLPVYDTNPYSAQSYLSSLKEFFDLKSQKNEKTPMRGERYKHQEFVSRYMEHNDILYIIHEPGTGKSCAIAGPALWFLKKSIKICKTMGCKNIATCNTQGSRYGLYCPEHKLPKMVEISDSVTYSCDEKGCSTVSDGAFKVSIPNDGETTNIKKCLVILSSDTLVQEMKRQLSCKCTPYGEYEDDEVNSNTDQSIRKRKLTKKLEKWFEFVTSGSFANELEVMTDEQIKDKYSNYFIVIDEAHKYVGSLEGKGDEDLNVDNKPVDNEESDEEDDDVPDEKSSNHQKEEAKIADKIVTNEKRRDQIRRLCYLAKNTKKIISTATPMMNSPDDLLTIISMVEPELKVPKNILSRIPSDPNDNSRDEELKTLFAGRFSFVAALDSGVTISEAGKLDAKTGMILYDEKMSDFQGSIFEKAINLSQNNITFSGDVHAAALMVFPDGSYGAKGKQKYIDKSGDFIKSFSDEINGNVENIKKYSIKYYNVCKNALNLQRQKRGILYAYEEYKVASGVDCLAACLRELGFEEFNSTAITFKNKSQSSKYCLTESSSSINPSFPKKKRYALLDSSKSPAQVHDMLQTLASPDNKYGEYIGVFICTASGRDGINLNHVVEIEKLTGQFNPSSDYQAVMRGIRATSHDILLKDKGQVTVNIRRHCAEYKGLSLDRELYKIMSEKDRAIKRVMRTIKRFAVDCNINHERNQVKGTDGESKCDYTTCQYKCYQPIHSGSKDITNYLILYSGREIAIMVYNIVNMFREKSVITLTELQNAFPEVDKRVILEACSLIIDEQIVFKDRYGFNGYLAEINDTYYIQQNFPNNPLPYTSEILVLPVNRKFDDLFGGARVEDSKILSDTKIETFNPSVYKKGFEYMRSYIEALLQDGKKYNDSDKNVEKFINSFIYRDDTKTPPLIMHALGDVVKLTTAGHGKMKYKGDVRIFNSDKKVWETVTGENKGKKKDSDYRKILDDHLLKSEPHEWIYLIISTESDEKEQGRYLYNKGTTSTTSKGKAYNGMVLIINFMQYVGFFDNVIGERHKLLMAELFSDFKSLSDRKTFERILSKPLDGNISINDMFDEIDRGTNKIRLSLNYDDGNEIDISMNNPHDLNRDELKISDIISSKEFSSLEIYEDKSLSPVNIFNLLVHLRRYKMAFSRGMVNRQDLINGVKENTEPHHQYLKKIGINSLIMREAIIGKSLFEGFISVIVMYYLCVRDLTDGSEKRKNKKNLGTGVKKDDLYDMVSQFMENNLPGQIVHTYRWTKN